MNIAAWLYWPCNFFGDCEVISYFNQQPCVDKKERSINSLIFGVMFLSSVTGALVYAREDKYDNTCP